MIPLGVILFAVGLNLIGPEAAHRWTANALAFSAGTFLCIALSDLLPELHFHAHDRVKLSVALLGGFALMALTSLISPHH
ncbi:MAG: ZIP family metal transporter [Isosphaeraceae bacterium]